jgi:hypothetical protein
LFSEKVLLSCVYCLKLSWDNPFGSFLSDILLSLLNLARFWSFQIFLGSSVNTFLVAKVS